MSQIKPETYLFSLETTGIWKALHTRGWLDGDREFPTLEEGGKPQTQANQVPDPIKAHPWPSFESLSWTKLILAVEPFQQVPDYFYASTMTMSHTKTRDWNRPFHSTPMKTQVACEGLALEGKERGVGCGRWKEKDGFSSHICFFPWEGGMPAAYSWKINSQERREKYWAQRQKQTEAYFYSTF